MTALDARVQMAVDDLARRCTAREHVWLQCSCTCPCQPRRQKLACHACELAAEAFSRACTAALGTPMQPDTPLLRALLTGRRVLTLLFGGPEIEAGEGGIDDAVWDRGSAAAVYDRDRPGPFGDLRSGAIQGTSLQRAKQGGRTSSRRRRASPSPASACWSRRQASAKHRRCGCAATCQGYPPHLQGGSSIWRSMRGSLTLQRTRSPAPCEPDDAAGLKTLSTRGTSWGAGTSTASTSRSTPRSRSTHASSR